jgi:hypothetical protein
MEEDVGWIEQASNRVQCWTIFADDDDENWGYSQTDNILADNHVLRTTQKLRER